MTSGVVSRNLPASGKYYDDEGVWARGVSVKQRAVMRVREGAGREGFGAWG